MKKAAQKKQKGSYTLEAVIVMSTIIFIIFSVISAFLLIYQNAVTYYVAIQAAQEGAVLWTDPSHSLDGTISDESKENGLYYRVGEMFSTQGGSAGEKISTIKGWAEKKLKEMTPDTMVGSGPSTVQVRFHNYVVYQELEVEITKEIDIPFKEIARYFSEDLDLHVTARASIADSAEKIRNMDYAGELVKSGWNMVKDKLGPILDTKK